ncbi:MAG: MerR family transcriptional regulator [Proteobacteria bacterium]|nr:MerR family transcriptional regulator [Pseudomonadota bacterium]
MTELRATAKTADAFRTISEAADEIGVPQHVLRFWETKFSFVRPMKRAGGRRFYRPQDIAVLRGVRTLLHDEGYTIKGVQRLHKEQGVRRLMVANQPGAEIVDLPAPSPEVVPFELEEEIGGPEPMLDREALQALREELLEAKFKLDAVLQRID